MLPLIADEKRTVSWSCAHPDRALFCHKDRHGRILRSSDEKVRIVRRPDYVYDRLRAKARNRPEVATIIGRFANASWLIPPLTRLRKTVRESREAILSLEDNWDGEGSLAYRESTWNRAQNFLMTNAMQMWRRHRKVFGAPEIQPGPYGSIDLHWRTSSRELLINVPANDHERISYYGDDKEEGTQNAVRGKDLDSSDAEWIFMWLLK